MSNIFTSMVFQRKGADVKKKAFQEKKNNSVGNEDLSRHDDSKLFDAAHTK